MLKSSILNIESLNRRFGKLPDPQASPVQTLKRKNKSKHAFFCERMREP